MNSTLQDYVLTQNIPQNKRILALDVGDKYIGLSISDGLQMTASPLELYKRKNIAHDVSHLFKIVHEYGCCLILIGFPQNLDGSLGAQAEKTITFSKKLEDSMGEGGIKVLFWDERFSTQAVEKAMLQFDYSRKKREELVDKLAATYILQGALDFLAMRRRSNP